MTDRNKIGGAPASRDAREQEIGLHDLLELAKFLRDDAALGRSIAYLEARVGNERPSYMKWSNEDLYHVRIVVAALRRSRGEAQDESVD